MTHGGSIHVVSTGWACQGLSVWLLAGLRSLEPALCSLQVLDLRHCGFGPQGASHIATALKHADCKLEVLRLDGNKISGNSLSRGLLGNESLRELHLAHTDIGDEGTYTPSWEHPPFLFPTV